MTTEQVLSSGKATTSGTYVVLTVAALLCAVAATGLSMSVVHGVHFMAPLIVSAVGLVLALRARAVGKAYVNFNGALSLIAALICGVVCVMYGTQFVAGILMFGLLAPSSPITPGIF